MKKKILISCIVVLIAFLGIYLLNYKVAHKFAYVDSDKLVGQYKGMIDAQKDYEKRAKVYQQNIDTLSNEFEVALKKYEKERSKMTEKEKAMSEELLNKKQKEYTQYRDAIQKKIQEEENKMGEQVLTKLNNYIKNFGEKNGYSLIFGANAQGNVVYGG